MTTYARIQNNVAVAIFTPQAGFTLADSFHPVVAEMWIEVPDGTVAGSTCTLTWSPPAE
jgi:hypothetical protein